MADELVLTPGGYRPRSRVHHVPPEHLVQMMGDTFEIRHRTRGRLETVGQIARREPTRPLLPDRLSQLRPAERSVPALAGGSRGAFADPALAWRAAQPGVIDGWVSHADWANPGPDPIERLSSSWAAPPEPARRGGQTLFLFNALQNASMIYQPVLQWGPSAAGGGRGWSCACWYAGSASGHVFFSRLAEVAVGETLTGVISLTGREGPLFSYDCQFAGKPDTRLPIQGVDELTFASHALEVYGVTGGQDFPGAPATVFADIVLRTGAAAAPVRWSLHDDYPASGSDVTAVAETATGGAIRISHAACGCDIPVPS